MIIGDEGGATLERDLLMIDRKVLMTALAWNREQICRELEEQMPTKIAVSSLNETEYIEIGSIVRMEASGCYTLLFLEDGRQLTVSRALRTYEKLLPERDFIRVHHSHVINMHHIRKFVRKDGLTLVMSDEGMVPVAIRRKEHFEQKLRCLTI